MKKILLLLIILAFLNAAIAPVSAYTQIPQFIFESGLRFYQQGRYTEALDEFQRALIVQPDFEPAIKYIEIIKEKHLIKNRETLPAEQPKQHFLLPQAKKTNNQTAMQSDLDKFEPPKPFAAAPVQKPAQKQTYFAAAEKAPQAAKKAPEPKSLTLDESFKEQTPGYIKIEKDKAMLVQGKNIIRYLVTQPDIITVQKTGSDQLLVTGKEYGFTYLHVWDERGRWSMEFLTSPSEPEGTTL